MPKTPKTIEGFDAIAFKRRAQARVAEAIRGMSHEEEIAHYERAAEEGPLGDWWKRIKQRQRERE